MEPTLSEKGQVAAGAVRLLTEARTTLSDRKRWTKGSYVDRDQVCALGAVSLAMGQRGHKPTPIHAEEHEALNALFNALPSHLRKNNSSWVRVAHYNDYEAKYPDILKLFDKAIACECKIVQREARGTIRGWLRALIGTKDSAQ